MVLSISAPGASIIIAIISAAISLMALISGYWLNTKLEKYKAELAEGQRVKTKKDEAQSLVAKYRDPLLRSAYDFQSRLYNVLRRDGFRGGRDPDYFRLNTLFVMAEFLGWLEIIRRDMQFLDIGGIDETKELNARIGQVQDCLAYTKGSSDNYYFYRGQQRAIGELMITRSESMTDRPGPRYECIGYASFVAKMGEDQYSKWFERIGKEIPELPEQKPTRLVQVQHALIDLIDMLDPNCQWYSSKHRHKL